MRQDQDVQYTLLCTRCLMHSDRMRTDAISESMIQVLYCRGAVIPYNYRSNSGQNMYILDYNENSTVQYLHVQTSCNTHYIIKQAVYNTVHFTMTLHNNNIIGLVSWIQIWRPFSFDHYASSTWYIMTCTVRPGLVS